MKKFLFLMAFVTLGVMYAQEDALVFLADKENVAASLANPISILTQDAIDRKQLHNTAIDERDVPVNEAYITQLKNTSGIEVLSKSKWMNAVYVRGSQANIENLTNLAFVTSVEFMDKSLNFWGGNDPAPDKFAMEVESSRIEYDYGAAENQTTMLGVDYLHSENLTGADMVIAVLDSGFPNFVNNPAFAHIVSEGRLLGTYDFAERQTNVDGTGTHGSSTSSDIGAIVAGNPNPEDNFVGTAPDASFYLFRTEYAPTENPVEEAWWVEALERADSLGVDVVNTSLGYQDYDNPAYDHSYEDLDGQTTIAARGANLAWEKGMLLVTSAGNDGQTFTFVATPADAPGVLTVGAVDSNGDYANFSSIGPTVDGRIKPDVMAKGASAAVVDPSGNVTFSSGTSFSSPIMAGAVASLWQSRPEVPNFRIIRVVRESAHLYENPTDQMGYGIPNFEMAWSLLQNLGVEDQLLESQFAIYPNPVEDLVNISFPKQVENATAVLYDIFGKRISEKTISSVENTIVMSGLAPGMYVLNITSEEKSNSFKVVKK